MWRAEPPKRPRRMGGGSVSAGAVGYRGLGRRPTWVSEGERVAPVDIAIDRVLIDTPGVVAFVAAAHVYPSGFSFNLGIRLRPTASAAIRDAFAEEFSHPLEPVSAEQAERRLRLGVRFADGRGAAFNPNYPWVTSAEPQQDVLPFVHSGHRSSDTSGIADCEIWVFGLPEEGDVTLFHRWLDFDVPEGSVELDGEALRAASARAVVLWDADAPDAPDAPDEAGPKPEA